VAPDHPLDVIPPVRTKLEFLTHDESLLRCTC
jgi:hypothetical protein